MRFPEKSGKLSGRTVAALLLCLAGFFGCASASKSTDLDASIRAAEQVLARREAGESQQELHEGLKQAKAIMIISPGVNRGVVLARSTQEPGWSSPAFYRVMKLDAAGGASGGAGFTLGKQDLELIALGMSEKSLSWFLSPQLPGQGKLTVVYAGERPPGGAVDVVLFARAESSGGSADRFGGGNFAGTLISVDKNGNQSYYGKPVTTSEILVSQSVSNPAALSLQKAIADIAR